MPNNPDMLHLGRRSDGSLIAVGLPWNAGIFIQEYWSRGIPWYAVANVSMRAAEVGVREWQGSAGPSLLDNWTIAPGSVQFHEAQSLLRRDIGSLIAISLDMNPVFGLLKAPRSPALPLEGSLDDIFTVDGLNGLGDRDADLLCRQTGLIFHSFQTISLALRIPGDLDTLLLGETLPSGSLPQIVIKQVASKTLFERTRGSQIVLESLEKSTVACHEIELTIELPATEAATIGALLGRVRLRNGAGFSFARGLAIHPSTQGGGERPDPGEGLDAPT